MGKVRESRTCVSVASPPAVRFGVMGGVNDTETKRCLTIISFFVVYEFFVCFRRAKRKKKDSLLTHTIYPTWLQYMHVQDNAEARPHSHAENERRRKSKKATRKETQHAQETRKRRGRTSSAFQVKSKTCAPSCLKLEAYITESNALISLPALASWRAVLG